MWRWRWVDAGWLFLLGVYVVAGAPLVPFHGDESMLMFASRDFTTAFIDGTPQALETTPPYAVDTPPHLRILNGSVFIHSAGLSAHVAGYTADSLPTLWQWGADYETNLGRGSRPSDGVLNAGRYASALYLALSVVAIFALGVTLRGRGLAYLVSGLYALHPVILLNGRRAMQEGAWLCFGLLTLLVALNLIKGIRQSGWLRVSYWALLPLVAALTVASKHSGALYVAAAFAAIATTSLIQRDGRLVGETLFKLTLTGLLAIGLFIALSPALWNNPPARIRDLLDVRADLLTSQVEVTPEAPTPLAERLSGVVTQPFIEAPAYFEAAFWAGFDPITREISDYEASPLRGLPYTGVPGVFLTGLAAVGMLTSARTLYRPEIVGLWVWTGVILLSLLANPLPWQRYYLPWIPVMILWAGLGIVTFSQWIYTHIRPADSAALSAPSAGETG